MPRELTENDRAEIEKFRLYLRACARWDKENSQVPDDTMELLAWRKNQLAAHAAIYRQIYGVKP